MAEVVLSIALEKLTDPVAEQLAVFAGATRELEKLSGTFQTIRAVLDDAESRQVRDESVKLWLSELKAISYDIEDVLDEWQISGDLGDKGDADEGDGGNKTLACLFSCYDSFGRVISRYIAAGRIKEIRERLDQIADGRNRYGYSRRGVGGDHGILVRSQRLTHPFMGESEMMIGRENDKEITVSRLITGSSNDDGQVHVIAIVGVGGMGKTTLARQIYNDSRVRDHFNMALYWVCVSDDFEVIHLTKAILEQVKRTNYFLSELETLQTQLLEALRGIRFLLVLDDVWNDDAEKWKKFCLPLNSGAQGSRILVTTRSKKVANTMNAAYIHELKDLSDDDSWELFRSRAFARRKSEERLELEDVGREIVKKCRGVPLLITVIGSAMNSKQTMEEWRNILNIDTWWSWPYVTDVVLPALLLTYSNLPSHLKQCFAYCSVFPKDWEFKKDMLVQIWVAQGFIRPQGNGDIEEIGGEYFDDLVAWSILQQVEKDGETRYTIHGLLHDLAEFIAKDEIPMNGRLLTSNVRHAFLSFADNDDEPRNILIAARGAKKLRTLWFHGIDRSDSVIVDLLHQARFLRALFFTDSVDCGSIVKSADIIGNLKHLRYLDLSCSSIEELPESVSRLRNLHNLNLSGCVKLKRLPSGLGGMVSLRHLEIERTDRLECLPKGLGGIRGLQSLCKFIVGGGCQIDELEQLNSLQGILRIQYLERVSSQGDAERAKLCNKPHLRRLVLSMLGKDEDAEIKRMDSVLQGLQPHANLEELKLFCYTGSKLPSWMHQMPCLRKLELYGCPNLKGLLYHLDSGSLRELIIRDCHRVEGIARSSSIVSLENISVIDSSKFFSTGLPHLSNLKTFEIRRFRNETLPDEGWERLVSLQTLEIWNCDELKCLPDWSAQLQSLENLIIFGCDQLEWLPEGLGQLKKLKALTIGVLEALKCLPESLGQLESLEQLEISSCDKLEWLPDSVGQLKKLKLLRIQGLQALSCLPDSLGLLESLEHLNICSLEKLELVPDSLGELKALNHLEICFCGALGSLPHGLQRLSLLRQLYISNCPLLSERCQREEGEDWPKICHIPCVTIE